MTKHGLAGLALVTRAALCVSSAMAETKRGPMQPGGDQLKTAPTTSAPGKDGFADKVVPESAPGSVPTPPPRFDAWPKK